MHITEYFLKIKPNINNMKQNEYSAGFTVFEIRLSNLLARKLQN
jgi:hypothetical protein